MMTAPFFFVRHVIEDDLHAPQRRFKQIELVFQKTIFDTTKVCPFEQTQTERVSFIVGSAFYFIAILASEAAAASFFLRLIRNVS